MDLQVINPLNYPQWDELLASREESSFFHSSYWAIVLYESYHYTPLYFILVKDNTLSVAVPFMEVRSIFTGHRGVALPFSDYCDPIVSKDISFQNVFNQIIEYGRQAGWSHIEVRGENDFFKDSPSSAYYYGHILDISQGESRVFSNLRDSTRRNIKKAAKEGVEVKIQDDFKSISEFYRLNCITRKYHGLPPQPYYFFEKVYDHIIKNKLGFMVLAYYKGKTISGAMYFHLGGKAVYKYGASDREYLQSRANNLVMWEAIKWYSMNGFKEFSFGRTEPEADGQRQFKTGWGAKEVVIKYYVYNLNKEAFISRKSKVEGFHNKLFGNLPIYFLKIIGALLYRHMG